MEKIKSVDRMFIVFSISRSGHHPIIDWIYDSCSPNKIFFNGMDSPIEKRRMYYLNNKKYYHLETYTKYYDTFTNSPKLIAGRISAMDKYGWIKEKPNSFILPKKIKNLVLKFENYNPQESTKDIQKRINNICGNAEEKIGIIIIRNPFNLIASRLIHGRPITKKERVKDRVDPEEFLQLWKSHANIALDHKKLKELNFDKIVIIKYDKWFNSPKMKKEIAKNLGLDKIILTFNKISVFGGGSSFDGYSFHNRAEKLKTTDRWHQLISNNEAKMKSKREQFIKLFKKHPEIKLMSEKIFGKTEGTDFLFN